MLWTIGYEDATIGDFIRTLKAIKIDCLIDVREIAISRRKGFAKSALSRELDRAGILYIHLRDLGDPKEGRIAARSGQFASFKKIYFNHLKTKKAQDALRAATKLVTEHKACLMCFERMPENCHRNIVAERISNILQLPVRHLGVHALDRVAA